MNDAPVTWIVQVACILLPLCFVYDIFWVFIEPLIMGGTSVMVEVGVPFSPLPSPSMDLYLNNASPLWCSLRNVNFAHLARAQPRPDMYACCKRLSSFGTCVSKHLPLHLMSCVPGGNGGGFA